MGHEITHRLTERVKELTALHRTARILQEDRKSPAELLCEIVDLLPSAWQYPEITSARIRFGNLEAVAGDFSDSPWVQRAEFSTRGGGGSVEVAYGEARPEAEEGPFLSEERDLIESLAEMLRSYFQHRIAENQLRRARDDLERIVEERTAELREANRALRAEVEMHRETREQVDAYQVRLRALASELCLAEERERRTIAADLHDHVGQALAFTRMRLEQLQGEAVFSGFEGSIAEILRLLDQTVAYTRTLTGEISPPVLYEFGLEAGLEWLGEQFRTKRGLPVEFRSELGQDRLGDEMRVMVFKSVRELLINVLKHARARQVRVILRRPPGRMRVVVEDDGVGIDPERVEAGAGTSVYFGLFSIRERMRSLGGTFDVAPGIEGGTRAVLEVPVPQEA